MARIENCAWHILPDLLHVASLPVCMLMTSSSPAQWVQGVQVYIELTRLIHQLLSPCCAMHIFQEIGVAQPWQWGSERGNSSQPKQEGNNQPKQPLPLTLVELVGLSWNFSSNSGSSVFWWQEWRTISVTHSGAMTIYCDSTNGNISDVYCLISPYSKL